MLLNNLLYSTTVVIGELFSQLSDFSFFRSKLESGCLLYRLHLIVIISSRIKL